MVELGSRISNREVMELTVVQKIKAYIMENGIKQVWLAEKSGIDFKLLNETLNGRRRLQLDEFERICEVLNVPPGNFMN